MEQGAGGILNFGFRISDFFHSRKSESREQRAGGRSMEQRKQGAKKRTQPRSTQ